MDALDIDGHTMTGDALLTQRKLASYLINRHAHYLFIAKDNQPTLAEAIRVLFENREAADYTEPFNLEKSVECGFIVQAIGITVL